MATAAFYRLRARECLALAEQARTEEHAKGLQRMAREYSVLAEMIGPDVFAFVDDTPKCTALGLGTGG
jgi:cellulase/cellobiase CelA1